MCAVMACVWICKEVTSASATMVLRLLRTRRCAWVSRETIFPGRVMELRLQKRLPFGHPPQVTTLSLSETVLTKNELCETIYGFSQCKICKQDAPQCVLGFSGHSFLPQMASTCLLTWAFRQHYMEIAMVLALHLPLFVPTQGASQVVLVVKNPPLDAGDIRDAGLIPGSGRSPGGGHGILLQYSCLENPMDRRAWRTTVHSVAESWTQLKQLCTHRRIKCNMMSIT